MYKIYSKDGCSFCERSKKLLESKTLRYIEVKIPGQVSKDEVQAMVVAAGSDAVVKSVPQIFNGGEYIGGYTQLLQSLST